jgi:hypothetical protein
MAEIPTPSRKSEIRMSKCEQFGKSEEWKIGLRESWNNGRIESQPLRLPVHYYNIPLFQLRRFVLMSFYYANLAG